MSDQWNARASIASACSTTSVSSVSMGGLHGIAGANSFSVGGTRIERMVERVCQHRESCWGCSRRVEIIKDCIVVNQCGHVMHEHCFRSLYEKAIYQCGKCKQRVSMLCVINSISVIAIEELSQSVHKAASRIPRAEGKIIQYFSSKLQEIDNLNEIIGSQEYYIDYLTNLRESNDLITQQGIVASAAPPQESPAMIAEIPPSSPNSNRIPQLTRPSRNLFGKESYGTTTTTTTIGINNKIAPNFTPVHSVPIREIQSSGDSSTCKTTMLSPWKDFKNINSSANDQLGQKGFSVNGDTQHTSQRKPAVSTPERKSALKVRMFKRDLSRSPQQPTSQVTQSQQSQKRSCSSHRQSCPSSIRSKKDLIGGDENPSNSEEHEHVQQQQSVVRFSFGVNSARRNQSLLLGSTARKRDSSSGNLTRNCNYPIIPTSGFESPQRKNLMNKPLGVTFEDGSDQMQQQQHRSIDSNSTVIDTDQSETALDCMNAMRGGEDSNSFLKGSAIFERQRARIQTSHFRSRARSNSLSENSNGKEQKYENVVQLQQGETSEGNLNRKDLIFSARQRLSFDPEQISKSIMASKQLLLMNNNTGSPQSMVNLRARYPIVDPYGQQQVIKGTKLFKSN